MPAVGEFEVVLRGFDRAQVRETVERLEGDVRVALTDRDAAVARSSDLASQLSALHAEMESLRRKLSTAAAPTYETMGERISKMLRLAEEEAADLRRAAQTDANAIREQAAAVLREASAQRQQADEQTTLLREKTTNEAAGVAENARRTATGHIAAADKKAAEVMAAAEASRDRMLAQTKERTAKAENDFEITLRGRRAESARADSERERASTAEAKRRVEEATREAAKRVGEATEQSRAAVAAAEQRSADIRAHAENEKRRVDELRMRALTQLRDVRALLEHLPADTKPAPEASAATAGAGEAGEKPATAPPVSANPQAPGGDASRRSANPPKS